MHEAQMRQLKSDNELLQRRRPCSTSRSSDAPMVRPRPTLASSAGSLRSVAWDRMRHTCKPLWSAKPCHGHHHTPAQHEQQRVVAGVTLSLTTDLICPIGGCEKTCPGHLIIWPSRCCTSVLRLPPPHKLITGALFSELEMIEHHFLVV